MAAQKNINGPPAIIEPFTNDLWMCQDPLYGQIELPKLCQVFIDSPEFQRMRRIQQMSSCSLVFPAANHSRWEHSIGVAHLTYQTLINTIKTKQNLPLENKDVLGITLAALLHDVGHCAFSHEFEVFMHEKALTISDPELKKRYASWSHEDASSALVKHLWLKPAIAKELEAHGLETGADSKDLCFVQELIDPPKQELLQSLEQKTLGQDWGRLIKSRPVEKAWMFEIVSNWRTGIDTDKMDYFGRDNAYTDAQGLNCQRYLSHVAVWNDNDQPIPGYENVGVPTLAAAEKMKSWLETSFFQQRRMNHQKLYKHRAVLKLNMCFRRLLSMLDATEHGRIQVPQIREKLPISEIALNVDKYPEAYCRITQEWATQRMESAQDSDDPKILAIFQKYQAWIIERKQSLSHFCEIHIFPPLSLKILQEKKTADEYWEDIFAKFEQDLRGGGVEKKQNHFGALPV